MNGNKIKLLVVANTKRKGALPALTMLNEWCSRHGIEPHILTEPVAANHVPEYSLVVALGGDGTVLRAAGYVADSGTPILGSNVGTLGFLTQVASEDLIQALEAVLASRYSIEERMRIAYRVRDGAFSGTVLNDTVVTGATDSRFCELELSWRDGQVATYPGDGIVLSTATGSTAYSLSAGGPIIVPPAACILATPLASHKLGLRSILFPADEVLAIRCLTPARLIADGDPICDLHPGDSLTIMQSSVPTQLVRIDNAPSFFRILTEKLNWGDSSMREAEQPEKGSAPSDPSSDSRHEA
ncbi:NAD(+)/NADH kinase [Candidatus Bipolaricaulota bacterium]|nr:NAD(+)/NADH kinase [Candidatus Bipolaricaulota bacterium]